MITLIVKYVLSLVGFTLIWVAVDLFRPNDKVKFMSKEWFIQLLLIIVAVILIIMNNQNN